MFDKMKSVYEEQLLELPAINQEALKSFDWQKKLFEVARKYGLHIDQTEDFWTETMLVLVGLESADVYRDKLMTELAVSPTDAEKITIDVNTEIFGIVHDFIVRGGPIIKSNPAFAKTLRTGRQEPNGAEEPSGTEAHTPMSFAPLIQTGVVIPVSGEDSSESNTPAPEMNMQASVEAVLDTPTNEEPRLREDATDGQARAKYPSSAQGYGRAQQEPNEAESDEAILSLESMLNGEVKAEAPAVQIGFAKAPNPVWTAPATLTVSPTPIAAPTPDKNPELKYQEPNDTENIPDKRSSALEKLQKMLAEENSTQTVISPQETTDHTLGKST